MEIVCFCKEHVPEAEQLAKSYYEEERRAVPSLPPVEKLPSLIPLAQNGLGAAAVERGKLIGFLACCDPFPNAFGRIQGVFSPAYANAAVWESRGAVYARLYQAAAEKWVQAGALNHAVSLYAHDRAGQESFYRNGFGLRCVDAMRRTEPLAGSQMNGCFREVERSQSGQLASLHGMLEEHMAASPIFMPPSGEDLMQEEEGTRYFAAFVDGSPVAYLKLSPQGEHFASEHASVINVTGAYCLPSYRGHGRYDALLNMVLRTVRTEGYSRLGVDYESFNPTASRYWPKHFCAYTHSVVRRIDERIFDRYIIGGSREKE